MITFQKLLDKWVGKRYREPWISTYECVWWVKKASEELYWIKGLSFGGSALNWWLGKWNLDRYFDREQLPKQWDLVFFDKTPTNPYWHVALHIDDYSICEQNWIWGGNGLWGNAIRVAKAPANALWFMRPKPIDMKPLQQNEEPDCSLVSTINCYRLNQWNDARSFTQEVVNEMMKSYINKHPRDAFQFLKDKKYNIKLLPLNFEQALVRIKRWSAICIFIKSKPNHWSCIKWNLLYDSNFPEPKEFDLVKAYNEWKIWKEFFQVK